MTNRLGESNSPYLLQHAENPVDWYPWSEEALQKAQAEDRPIFLSIGYAACHWCHVMAHESFEDVDVARIMNDNFISIKVDREERPDLDSIYMSAVVAMTGQGGWPMSVFLTPRGEPFFGGTYFPPRRRYNLPSFLDILKTIERLWREDRQKLLESSQEITQHIQRASKLEIKPTLLTVQALEQASYRLAQSYDWKNGGWGQAPKFPQPMTIEFLLRRASHGDQLSLDIASHALDAMSRGGMYDILGGGFCRYSTDNEWLVPHFEKMLYDNALLGRVYLYAYLITREQRYREIHEATLDFILRELTSDEGGFHSSLDADSEGEEGKYYLWDLEEIRTVLVQSQQDSHDFGRLDWVEFYTTAYDLKPEGNFGGRIVLQRAVDDRTLAEVYGISAKTASELLNHQNKLLHHRRENRVRPSKDDKIILSWNALSLQVFAESARYLGRDDYLEAARRNASFIQNRMKQGNRLLRTWRRGKAQNHAFLEDYASLILALIALYQSDPTDGWYQFAYDTTNVMLELFSDPNDNFYDSALDSEPLILRPRDLQDNATPSGNSLAAQALIQMSTYSGNAEWRKIAENQLASVLEAAIRYPTAFANWLIGIHLSLAQKREIAILFPASQHDISPLSNIIWGSFQPNIFVAASSYPPKDEAPELLKNRQLIDDKITIYVCQDFVCKQPVNSPEELRALLLN